MEEDDWVSQHIGSVASKRVAWTNGDRSPGTIMYATSEVSSVDHGERLRELDEEPHSPRSPSIERNINWSASTVTNSIDQEITAAMLSRPSITTHPTRCTPTMPASRNHSFERPKKPLGWSRDSAPPGKMNPWDGPPRSPWVHLKESKQGLLGIDAEQRHALERAGGSEEGLKEALKPALKPALPARRQGAHMTSESASLQSVAAHALVKPRIRGAHEGRLQTEHADRTSSPKPEEEEEPMPAYGATRASAMMAKRLERLERLAETQAEYIQTQAWRINELQSAIANSYAYMLCGLCAR